MIAEFGAFALALALALSLAQLALGIAARLRRDALLLGAAQGASAAAFLAVAGGP